MTVQRKSSETFNFNRDIVGEAVRKLLKKTPPYRDTIQLDKNLLFKTTVKPSRWLLGTNMTISLEDEGPGTLVTVETKSQWYVFGDVFNCYNRYIKVFLNDLKKEIQYLMASR